MKKFLLVTVISLVTLATAFAATTTSERIIPWDSKDISKINEAITKVQANTSLKPEQKNIYLVRLTILKNIVEKNLTSFSEIKNEVETVVNASSFKNKDKNIQNIIYMICLANSNNDQLIQEAASYIKEHPYYGIKVSKFHMNRKLAGKIGLTNDQLYTYILTYLKRYGSLKKFDSKIALAMVKRFTYLCTKVSYTSQKEDLTSLNRIFTRKLIENKTQWEPVVVQIRTALETY